MSGDNQLPTEEPGDEERLLANCLRDYDTRRAKGESVNPEDYRAQLGDALFDQFREIVRMAAYIEATPKKPGENHVPRRIGNYDILDVAGSGGAGVVYHARDRKIGREVALKLPITSPEVSVRSRRQTFERFRREAEACSRANNPNLVVLYEFGEIEGQPYYAMSLVRGRPLNTVLGKGPVTDLEAWASRFADLAEGIHALHEEGIVHRDIKPSNIMVKDNGRLVLADFGLARADTLPTLTKTNHTPGTPPYMSPEQIEAHSRDLDCRTDVYSLGVTVYEAITGFRPRAGRNLVEIIDHIRTKNPTPILQHRPDTPVALARIVMKSIERNRDDRYATAQAFADDLRAFATSRPVAAAPVPQWRKIGRWIRSHPLLSGGLASALLVTVVWAILRVPNATLELRVDGHVAVRLDDRGYVVDRRETFSLQPGPVLLTVYWKLSGYMVHTQTIQLEPGMAHEVHVAPRIASLDGTDAPFDWAKRHEIPIDIVVSPTPPGTTRGELDRVVPVFPRGRVRLQDLMDFHIEFPPDDESPGRVVFQRGNETLFEAENPGGEVLLRPIPSSVLSSLRLGDAVTWGFFGANGSTSTATFEIVDDDLSDAQARLDSALTMNGAVQSSDVQAFFHAQLLLSRKLDHAAYRRLREAPASSLSLIALEGKVLARTFGTESRHHERTRLWHELGARFDTLRRTRDELAEASQQLDRSDDD